MDLVKSIDIVIKKIDENTNMFYQDKKNIGYVELNETLMLIGKVIDAILIYEEKIIGQKISENKYVEILSEAMVALERRDELLLSDILEYDLKDMFIQLKESISC